MIATQTTPRFVNDRKRAAHSSSSLSWFAVLLVAGAALLPAIGHSTVGVALAIGNATPTAGGAAFSYTVTMTNNDTAAPATNVLLTLPMPPSVNFLNFALVESSSVVPPAGSPGFFSCTTPAVGENGLIQCRAGTFPASTAGTPTVSTLTIVAQVKPDVASGVRTITARVAAGGVQFSDSKQQNIVVNAPLSISKAASSTAARGGNVAYTISVQNVGSSTALNATISDTLPATTTFVSMSGTGAFHDGCSFDASSNKVECLAVDVPTGQSKLNVLAKTSAATPLGTLTNTATITFAGTGTIAVGTANASTNITP